MDISAFLEEVGRIYGPQIITILALTVVQVLLAVAVALKNKVFEWAKLGDFYTTLILPKLIGWLAATIITRFVIASNLPADSLLGPGIEITAFSIVILSYAGSILANFRALEILPPVVETALGKVGVPKLVPKQAVENVPVAQKQVK